MSSTMEKSHELAKSYQALIF